MRKLILIFAMVIVGCDGTPNRPSSPNTRSPNRQPTLLEARRGFTTTIVKSGESYGAPDTPPGNELELIHYQSPVGRLAAYVAADPGDGKKHPAIVWITGGDNNSIGDVWSPQARSNDQSASAFRKAGIVMMFPSQRGGNNNPGKREGFYGEVDDILAATNHLAKLPYVDANQIYLGGHSTGGTMVMLVGACSDRFRAIFSLGPVAAAEQYGGDYVYCDPKDEDEMRLRSPIYWMHCVKSPMYVFEGEDGNWDGAIEIMADENSNPMIQFLKIPGHDHFSVIAPLAEMLASQIVAGQINVTQEGTLVDRIAALFENGGATSHSARRASVKPNGRLTQPAVFCTLDDARGDVAVNTGTTHTTGKIEGHAAWTQGRIDGGLRLDGETYIDLGSVLATEADRPLSICLWLNVERSKNSKLVSRLDSDERGFDLALLRGTVWFQLIHRPGEDALQVYSQSKLSTGRWHHVAATYDGNRRAAGVRLYFDGKPVATSSFRDNLSGSIRSKASLTIGRHTKSRRYGHLEGIIDDVRIYNHELQPDELLTLIGNDH